MNHLFVTRFYTVEFLKTIIEKLSGNSAQLVFNEQISPPQLEIHLFHKPEHVFPEILSIYEWAEHHLESELNETYGEGRLENILVDDDGYEVTFFWEATEEPAIKIILELSGEEAKSSLEEYANYHRADPSGGWCIGAKILLLVYQMLKHNGIESLGPYLPTSDRELRYDKGKNSINTATLWWLLYFWERIHNRTIDPRNPGDNSYKDTDFPLSKIAYVNKSPSKYIENWFSNIHFEVPFDDKGIIEGLEALATCPDAKLVSQEAIQIVTTSETE